ncbi:MAG: hypothetical protein COA44_15325 [Arcobacter sp.]|nr:MAG: hypothetical protein COA44_15325 [Arcobacter sp.]
MKASTYLYALLAIVLLSIALYIPAYLFLNQQKQEKTQLHFSNQISQTDIEFEAIKNSYELVSKSIFDNVINKEDVVSLVKKANAQDDEGKAVLRQKLYTMLLPLYKNLNAQGIRQLHFHLKNSVSFLRFHRPKKFGDSLEGVRYSINKVNRTFKPEHGFEEGRVFNGFRHVYPLIYKNKFAGTVEISYSFNALRHEQMKLSTASYNFIMLKEIISEKAWKSELTNYENCLLSPLYLQDKSSLVQAKKSDFTQDELKIINVSLAVQAQKKLPSEVSFLLHTKLKNKNVLVIFIPVLNVENKQVAYFISYAYDKIISNIEKTYEVELYVATFTAIILSILFVLYILSQKRTAKALERLATTDPLTGIANRNKLNIILEKSMHLSLRYKLPLSVIFFDIDHFKKINDEHGHDAGDTVLTTIATLINHHIRSSDVFARWGGEEFIIVLPETEHDKAHMLAEKFRKIINDYKFLPDVTVTCSFGVTQLHENDDESSLLKRVDNALYSAKEHGRNKVVELA